MIIREIPHFQRAWKRYSFTRPKNLSPVGNARSGKN